MDLVVVPDWILRVGFLRRRTCRDLGARVRGLRALCCELLHFDLGLLLRSAIRLERCLVPGPSRARRLHPGSLHQRQGPQWDKGDLAHPAGVAQSLLECFLKAASHPRPCVHARQVRDAGELGLRRVHLFSHGWPFVKDGPWCGCPPRLPDLGLLRGRSLRPPPSLPPPGPGAAAAPSLALTAAEDYRERTFPSPGSAPYADFSLFGPHGLRLLRSRPSRPTSSMWPLGNGPNVSNQARLRRWRPGR